MEVIELIHVSDSRVVVGKALVKKLSAGKLSVRMKLPPAYAYLRPVYRDRIGEYMDAVSESRKRTFGDRFS